MACKRSSEKTDHRKQLTLAESFKAAQPKSKKAKLLAVDMPIDSDADEDLL